MPTFSYKVKDKTGATRTGTIEAESEHAAASMIREAGGFPMEIRPVVGVAPSSQLADGEAGNVIARYLIYPIWTGVNIRALVFFYRQLATLIGAGMSLSEALRSVNTRMGGPLSRIVARAHARVQAGGRLSDELSRYPKVFAPLQVSLIRIGESGGLMEGMLDRLASYLEYEIEVRRRIAKAIFYPILVLLFIVFKPVLIALALSSTEVAVAVLLARLRTCLLPFVIVIVVLKLVFQFRIPRLIWDTVKIVPPVIGTAARKIAMSRFCRALALLHSAGMPPGQSLHAAAAASANLAVAGGIERAVPLIQAGEGLTESLRKTGKVMPMVLDMLATGEKTGAIDSVLQKVADYADDEADATIHKLGIAIFVLMILVAAVLVLVELVGFYGGMASRTMEAEL